MSDVETGSLWSHLLGEAMEGKFKGTQLTRIPSVITSWADWKVIHPETSVMIWPQRQGKRYDTSFFNQSRRNTFAIGYVDGEVSKSYPNKLLLTHPLVNDLVADTAILLSFDSETGAAWCFERNVNGKVLTFAKKDNQVVDAETGSIWNLKSGIATAGPMKDTNLKPRVVIPTYEQAWSNFHPDSVVYTP